LRRLRKGYMPKSLDSIYAFTHFAMRAVMIGFFQTMVANYWNIFDFSILILFITYLEKDSHHYMLLELFLHLTTMSQKCFEYIRVFDKVTVSLGLLSPPIPSFNSICKVILLNLSMKCWNSAFNNAQGSRVIIVINVEVGAMKIYVVALRMALRKKKDRMKLSLPPKLLEKLV